MEIAKNKSVSQKSIIFINYYIAVGQKLLSGH